MKKYLPVLALLAAGLTCGLSPSAAQTEKPTVKKTAAKPNKKTSKKAPAKAAAKPVIEGTESDDDGSEPDISGTHTDYQCDLGAEVTIYENKTDPKHVALRWGKIVHRMRRIETTTGAERFENRKSGLIWIGIPAKGILLDAKKGQQLANECKSPDQLAGKMRTGNSLAPAAAATAPASTSASAESASVSSAPAAPAQPMIAPAAPATAPAPAEPPKDAGKS